MNKIRFPNEETASVQGKRLQEANQISNAPIISLAPKLGNCDKSNLIARLTRAGHLVHEGSEHSFTVVHPRFGMSRYCADRGALQSFARTVGALS